MEKAFHDLAGAQVADKRHQAGPERRLVRVYGLRPDLLAMSQVWQNRDGQDFIIAAKGAPEAIAELCHFAQGDLKALRRSADSMAAEGLRVLAVARSSLAGEEWPEAQRAFVFEFLGLVGLADPLRPNVPAAVKECRSAGIRVIMITCDYPATAGAMAQQAGLDADQVVTGAELDRLK